MKYKVVLKRVLAISTTSLLVGLSIPPSLASEEADLNKLCSSSPYNSRCEGYQARVSLKQRPGEEAACALTYRQTSFSGDCKLVLADDKMTVYIEEGQPLDYLDDRKPTKEINIVFSDVETLGYQDVKKDSRGRLIRNTLLFGVLGTLFTKPRKLSQIDIGFIEKTEQDQDNKNLLTLVTKRDAGVTLKEKLEQATGRGARMQPETEE